MPQIVRKVISSSGAAFIRTTLTQLGGLIATILTGAGWIEISAVVGVTSSYAGENTVNLTLYIDGVAQTQVPDGSSFVTLPQNGYRQIFLRAFARLGAGTHTFAVYGYSTQDTANVISNLAYLVVTEVGY